MLSFWGTLSTYSQDAALPDVLLLEVSEGGESERFRLEREGLLAAAAAAEAWKGLGDFPLYRGFTRGDGLAEPEDDGSRSLRPPNRRLGSTPPLRVSKFRRLRRT